MKHNHFYSYSFLPFSYPCSDSDYLYSPFCAKALALSLSKKAS